MRLNEAQERGLAVTLRLLESRLDEIDGLLTQDREGVLYARRTVMPPDRVAELSRLSQEARALLALLASRFHLPCQEQDGLRIISALLSSSWEALEDARPRKLARYGKVDPTLRDELGPPVDRLIELVLAMEKLTR